MDDVQKSTNVLICHRHKLLDLTIITVIIVIVAVSVLAVSSSS
jgi:hypothetical protein